MRLRPVRPASPRPLAIALVAGLVLSACGVRGAPVPACEGASSDRHMAIASPDEERADEAPIAVECWRAVGRERVEVWFSASAGNGCWDLSRANLRESADAVSITLLATNRGECGEGTDEERTQLDLQAPIEDRTILDGSRS